MKSTSQLQEINHYQDQDFPVNVYYSDIHSMQPPGRWLRDFHWHDELQFTLVLSGALTMQADNLRSEERRVGKECRSRWSPYH